MSIYLWQSIFALGFLAFALAALWTMFTVMGKLESQASPIRLRRWHKIFGSLFTLVLIAQSIVSLRHVRALGDQLSLRAVGHAVLALTLIVVFALKILSVSAYKKFLKYAPVLGMMVFGLSFLVAATSAGYYFLRMNPPPLSSAAPAGKTVEPFGDAANGERLFRLRCQICHSPDNSEKKTGPGLKRVLKQENLPSSGRPATGDNIIEQLRRPVSSMPAFPDISPGELADLLSFLETL